MRRNHRPDNVRESLVQNMEALGGTWIPSGPFDGWLNFRGIWHLCELKDPAREGHKNEYTPDQIVLMARLKERQAPFHVLRREEDVFVLMGARRTA